MASPALRLGVDLGGTKIEIAALGPDGALLARRRVPAPQGTRCRPPPTTLPNGRCAGAPAGACAAGQL